MCYEIEFVQTFCKCSHFCPHKAEKSSLLKALVATIYKKKDYIWPDWMWWWGEKQEIHGYKLVLMVS